jgi:hypothetical protein
MGRLYLRGGFPNMNIDRDIIQILAGWSLILLFGVLLVVLQQCSVSSA